MTIPRPLPKQATRRRWTLLAAPLVCSLSNALARPVNGASLAVFRIAVGLVMALEGYALLVPHDAAITSGTPLEHYYTGADITFHWPYAGFEWLPMLSPMLMYGLVGLLCLAGLTMALGLFYRLSVATVFLIWAYLFAVESTRSYWQSHFYLELLFCYLLIWMPAARRYSLDAWRRPQSDATGSVPFWTIVLLRGQLVITYFYAGIAKFHLDWIVDAVPVRWYLADPNITVPYEPFLSASQLKAFESLLHDPRLAYFLSWTGAAFDVGIGFLLLVRRTRIFGLVLMLIFHASNHLLIFDDIGWFPLVGAATSLIFLDPDWPERFGGWLRRPRLRRPDCWWTLAGGLIFPVVGLSLGWRLKPTTPVGDKEKRYALGKYVVPLVCSWLAWQALVPVRHYFIPGDARFTYEGFSFSWRLKADSRHSLGHTLEVVDEVILASDSYARTAIDWSQWPDDPVVYRRVHPGHVVWPAIPEFSVVLEPILGERVVYNPFSGLRVSYTDDEAARRVRRIWRDLYGEEPDISIALSVSDAVNAILAACHDATVGTTECEELRSLVPTIRCLEQGLVTATEAGMTLRRVQRHLRTLLANQASAPVVRPIVRRIYPLALQGEPWRPAAFFIVDDATVMREEADGSTRIVRSAWKHHSATRQPSHSFDRHEGATPLLVYMGQVGADAKRLLPQAYLTDTHGLPKVLPRIQWNSLRDMTTSKYMHASAQAFYLRRYARRVASIWEEKCGRRPVIRADTAVSYNGRPHQRLVSADVNLASVAVRRLGHNEWVRDLEMRRIPRAALAGKPTGYRLRRKNGTRGASAMTGEGTANSHATTIDLARGCAPLNGI